MFKEATVNLDTQVHSVNQQTTKKVQDCRGLDQPYLQFVQVTIVLDNVHCQALFHKQWISCNPKYKKTIGFKSGDQGGHLIGPPLPFQGLGHRSSKNACRGQVKWAGAPSYMNHISSRYLERADCQIKS